MDPSQLKADSTVTFTIVFQSDEEVFTRTLGLPAIPQTVVDLQVCVEKVFSVPRCCQTVSLESVPLRGTESLSDHRVRSGDTFHVRYTSVADVEDLLEVLHSMQVMAFTIETQQSPGPYNTAEIITLDQLRPEPLHALASVYFFPCSTKRAIANRLFFLDQHGLEVLHQLFSLVSQKEWCYTPTSLQCLEQAILRVLWNITAAFDVRLQVLKYPFLELCIRSVKRVKIERREMLVAPVHMACTSHAPGSEREQNERLAEVIFKACGTICNLAEIPDCQVPIASDHSLMTQFTAIMLSPSYLSIVSLVAVSGMQCLAYNPDTHKNLVRPEILEAVMEAAFMEKMQDAPLESEKNLTLFRYFASLFFAHILTASLELVPASILPRIFYFIKYFLATADPEVIYSYEVKNGYIWSTVQPHMNLIYFPLSAHTSPLHSEAPVDRFVIKLEKDYDITSRSVNTEEVYLQCIELGVVSLLNMTQRRAVQQLLRDEGLIDYVTCMPWMLPRGSIAQQKAVELVTKLSQCVKLQPPSLIDICRAKLASVKFGLNMILKTNSVQELCAIVTPQININIAITS